MIELKITVREFRLPDQCHFVEIVTKGMFVYCKVYEDRGSYRKIREIFEISKTKHRWYDQVELFKKIASEKYCVPITERLNNSHKAGSV